jgi:hypothetical protein
MMGKDAGCHLALAVVDAVKKTRKLSCRDEQLLF